MKDCFFIWAHLKAGLSATPDGRPFGLSAKAAIANIPCAKIVLLLSCFLFTLASCAQQTSVPTDRPHCNNPDFDKKVSSRINFTVPVISCQTLDSIKGAVALFDTRRKKEYNISHIEGATYLGYKDFDIKRLNDLPKDTTIVLYCSIGYRSEKIGEKLEALGYTNVYNLYGSIFEWVNLGYPIVNQQNKPTKDVHTYNWIWSKWVDEEKANRKW